MGMEWKSCSIGDLGKIITGKTPRTAIEENYGGDIPFLSPSDNMSVKYLSTTQKTITKLGLSEVKNCLIPKGSICVSCIGSDLGKVIVANKDLVTNQQINSIIVNQDNSSDFVYYVMLIAGKELNYLSKTSTAVPIINKSTFSKFEIRIPKNKNDQQRIADILSSLDAKIENNNKINAKLEEMAQALFKSWFIDFEPFKVGRDESRPAFGSGNFVESELGMIPEGWKVGILADLGDIVGGGTPSKSKPEYYTEKGIAWLTPKDLSISPNKFTSKGETDITEIGYKNSSAKLMPKGSVLFSSRAPIGYISIAKNDICTNQGFKSVVPNYAGTAYIYYLLKYLTPDIENKSTGSTFKEASGSLMKSLTVIIPPKQYLDDFELKVSAIFDKQEILEEENKNLSQTRDTLLPKLMSGEIEL